MAALTDDSQVPVTSPNVAFLLFGQQLYSEYLEFHASIVFPRSSNLYKDKEEWLEARDFSQLVPRGHLPDLRVYKAFMHWLHMRGKLFTMHEASKTTRLVIEKLCGHAMHPAIRSSFLTNTACPVCTMEQNNLALSRAWKAWKALGAPDRSPPYDPQELSSELYHIVKHIWRFEKNRWAGLKFKYEELSKEVVAWEDNEAQKANLTYTPDELKEARSVLQALQFARENDPHLIDKADVSIVPHPLSNRRAVFRLGQTDVTARNEAQEGLGGQSVESRAPLSGEPPSPPRSPGPQKLEHAYPSASQRRDSSSPSLDLSPPRSLIRVRKAVAFAAEVSEKETRIGFEFRRTSISYRPGRYACPSEHGWADTSFCLDEDFEYDNELEELEEKHQRFLALFDPCQEDTDPHVDENVIGDTESDTDSESSSSKSDSDSEPVEEPEEIEDPLSGAIMHPIELEVDSVGEFDHSTSVGSNGQLGNYGALSEDDVQLLGAVNGLSNAALKTLLSSNDLAPAEVAEEGLHMVDVALSMGSALQSSPLENGTGAGLTQVQEITRATHPDDRSQSSPLEDAMSPDSEAANDGKQMITGSVCQVGEPSTDAAQEDHKHEASPK
ncbi:hypothetical protein SLS60_011905 [Paraconiothyrium brasiliense]|uniref:Uncharacterized protein n=1 Tax=Paraconiothyrium brasiliense TaxID=300254 RepID=A0ABR3QHT2_9PLEO